MQNFRMLSAIAAGAVLLSGAAYAQTAGFRGEARLVTAAPAPRAETIAGAAWRCDGDACVGVADRRANLDSPVRECKKVVAVVGPVASYKSGGRTLDDGQLKACNKAVADVQTAAK